MDGSAHNPFAILTLIVAPAILTNACSVLAMSTSNRFLRASERMRTVAGQLRTETDAEHRRLLEAQVNRIEVQALHLLHALRTIYLALGAFAGASLVSIFGAILASMDFRIGYRTMVFVAVLVGFAGVASVMWSCAELFRATRLSLQNISDEATLLRAVEAKRRTTA